MKEFCINYNKLTCNIPDICSTIDKELLKSKKECVPNKSKNIADNLKSLKKLIKKKIKQKKIMLIRVGPKIIFIKIWFLNTKIF